MITPEELEVAATATENYPPGFSRAWAHTHPGKFWHHVRAALAEGTAKFSNC